MVVSTWGTKRSCPKCGAHFYDLNKNPATCPKCKYIYDATLVVRPRRGRSKKPVSVELAEERMQANKEIAAMNKKKKAVAEKDEEGLDDFEDVEVDASGEEIEEVEDEIETIEEVEGDKSSNADDADDESIMEDLEDMDETIVDTVDEDSEESEDEEETSSAKKKSKKSAPKKGKRK